MKKGDEDVARELPEKYRRLNEKAFADAKKKFDERFGWLFTHERKIGGGKFVHQVPESLADKSENRLRTLIERYAEKSFLLEDGDGAPTYVGDIFSIEEQLCYDEWIVMDDEYYPLYVKDGLAKDIEFRDIDETLQAERIRKLFKQLVEAGAKIAHEIGSDTYQQWRELFLYVAGFYPPMAHHWTKKESDATVKRIYAFYGLHRKLWADLQIMGKANAPKRELGEWAKRFVADYDAKHGFVELVRGQQRSFRIPEKSVKAWDILTRLFTANDPEGWAKLVPNWKSHFIRKIGSTSEIDRESDLVKIAAMIRPHTPGKGRASDGKYRFEPIRLARKNLK